MLLEHSSVIISGRWLTRSFTAIFSADEEMK
jgi:hypothetical protein